MKKGNDYSKNAGKKQWIILTSLAAVVIALVIVLVVLINRNQNTQPPAATESKKVETLEEMLGLETEIEETVTEEPLDVNIIDNESEEGITVKKTVEEYLNTFVACDIEELKRIIHPDDAPFFNFDSENQVELFKAIFPKITYQFHEIQEYNGAYGVLTTIKAPNMTEAIGSLHIEQIDKIISNDSTGSDDMLDGVIEDILNDKLGTRDFDIVMLVQYDNGEYIARCNHYIANALLGGYPEAIDELADAALESMSPVNE